MSPFNISLPFTAPCLHTDHELGCESTRDVDALLAPAADENTQAEQEAVRLLEIAVLHGKHEDLNGT